jgi:hypothetical protein
MNNFWQKIKDFFRKIWNGLTVAGRIIAGLIILGLLALVVYAATDKNKDNDENKNPEVAQTFEPGSNGNNNGNVSGAVTNEPSRPNPTDSSAPTPAPAPAPTVERVAPPTGINPDAPIKYSNDKLRFAITLPAGSNVAETENEPKL